MKIIAYGEILSSNNLSFIANIIKNDGVIIYPTDTLYGLGGNFFSSTVIKTIDKIKERQHSSYSIAVEGLEMLEKMVEGIPETFYNLYKRLLPGRFTFLFYASKSIKKKYLKNSNKIGIRIPDLPGLLAMIRKVDIPLITTSVNKRGQEPLNSRDEIIKTFSKLQPNEQVSLFIDAGNLPPSMGSTIVDLTETPIRCIRKGDDYNKLEEFLEF